MKRAVIVYWSKTGNTEKVAFAIERGLAGAEIDVHIKRVEEAGDIDFYDYDLVCIGSPSYQWLPPKPMTEFLKSMFNHYRVQGRVKLGAPRIPGKNVLIFCTYSGPHTGINEAIPVGKYIGQFFEHLGFNVVDEWYILGEYHGSEERSTGGRMGDIKGKPGTEDLEKIVKDAESLAKRLFQ